MNLIESMARLVQVVIKAKLGILGVSTKTDSSNVTHSKVYINSITKAKCLIFGTKKAKMICFVPQISHGFSFIP